MPTICELNAAQWTTLQYVPNDIRDDWSRIFLDCLAKLVASPSIDNLTFLHMETKVLLATVRYGGRARADTTNRLLRHRFQLWHSGQVEDLWQRLQEDHTKRSSANMKKEEEQQQREARRVAKMVDPISI